MGYRRSSTAAWSGGLAAGAVVLLAAAIVAVPRSGDAPADAGVAAQPPIDAAALPPPPPPSGAFARGGAPRRFDVLDDAFRDSFPAYAIALDRWARDLRAGGADDSARDALDRAAEAVLTTEVREALGRDGARALDELLQRARGAAGVFHGETDDAADALIRAVVAVNDAMAAADLGYAVDADVLSYRDGSARIVLLFGFGVERVEVYRSAGTPVRVLHLRRLDNLNWSYNLLGFTSPQRRQALVLLGSVEERVVDRVLPLFADQPLPFFDLTADDYASEWYPRLAERVARVARAEYAAGGDVAMLGALVARRKRIYEAWNDRLGARGMRLDPPERLVTAWRFEDELRGVVPDGEIRELRRIEARLDTGQMRAAFDAVAARLTASVERHEVQHRLDAAGPPLRLPEELEDFVGPLEGADGEPRRSASRALAELSAYVAELARDPDTVRFNLAVLVQFLVDPDQWGTAESYAAIVTFEGLAADLELAGDPALIVDREVDRARATEIFLALTDLEPAALREAAGALWQRLFDRPLPPLARDPGVAPDDQAGSQSAP